MDFPQRTCNICSTQGTPVWRCGPYGLSMCNACRVRFMTSKQSLPKYSRGSDMPVVPTVFGPLPAEHAAAKLPGSLHPGTCSDSTKRTRRKRPQVKHPRKTCSNCGSHKTPQWRCGPEGLETLCNACGVRLRKGLPLMCTVPKGSRLLLPGIEPDKPTAPTSLLAEHAPARALQPKAPKAPKALHPTSATGWHEQPECSTAPTEGPFEDSSHEEGIVEPEMEHAIAQGALWERRRRPGLDVPRIRKLRSIGSLLLDPRAMPGEDLQHCQRPMDELGSFCVVGSGPTPAARQQPHGSMNSHKPVPRAGQPPLGSMGRCGPILAGRQQPVGSHGPDLGSGQQPSGIPLPCPVAVLQPVSSSGSHGPIPTVWPQHVGSKGSYASGPQRLGSLGSWVPGQQPVGSHGPAPDTMVERYPSFDRHWASAQDAAQVDTGSPRFDQVPRRKRSFMPPAADAARHSDRHHAEANADLCVSQQLRAIPRAVSSSSDGQAEPCGQQAEKGRTSLSLQETAGKAGAAVPRNSNATESLAHSYINQQAGPTPGATGPLSSHEVQVDGQLAELPTQSKSLQAEFTEANGYFEADIGDLTSTGDEAADVYSDIDQQAHATPDTAWRSSNLKAASDGYLEITAAEPGSSSQGEADAAYPRSRGQSEAVGYEIIKEHASATLDAAAELTGRLGNLGQQHQMCQSRHALSHERGASQNRPHNASAADEQADVASAHDTMQRQSAVANKHAAQQASPCTKAKASPSRQFRLPHPEAYYISPQYITAFLMA